jgi:hypothetical protein
LILIVVFVDTFGFCLLGMKKVNVISASSSRTALPPLKIFSKEPSYSESVSCNITASYAYALISIFNEGIAQIGLLSELSKNGTRKGTFAADIQDTITKIMFSARNFENKSPNFNLNYFFRFLVSNFS